MVRTSQYSILILVGVDNVIRFQTLYTFFDALSSILPGSKVQIEVKSLFGTYRTYYQIGNSAFFVYPPLSLSRASWKSLPALLTPLARIVK